MSVTIDLNRLTYREYREFLAAGDTIALLAKVITAWDFAGDPGNAASYENLGLLDLLAIQKELREAIANAGN